MLHFTPRSQWEAASGNLEYRPAAMAEEGFVHFSYGHQLARSAAKWSAGATDLVLLVVDPAGLEADIQLEGGFPHLYRPVPLESVQLVADLPLGEDGTFTVPEEARLAELVLTALPSAETAVGRVRTVMAGFDGPWWLGGGWAIDAGAESPSRPHLDLDVAVLRRDMDALLGHLADWDLRLVDSGRLTEWEGTEYPASENQLWARPDDGFRPPRWQDFALDPGFMEFLAEDVDDSGDGVFRRDGAVGAPLERLGPPGGFLAAEVALLYKAKAVTDPAAGTVTAAKAQGDFDSAVSRLTEHQKEWLAGAVETAYPGHPWLEPLSERLEA